MDAARAGWTVAALLGGVVGLACGAGFACKGDDDCRSGERHGTCESSGWCSFPDASCPSGARYGEHAGGALARTCVPGDGQADSGSEGSSGGAGTSSAVDAESSAGGVTTAMPGTSDDSGGSEGTPSICGDGILAAGEGCDDGNTDDGDGCSSSCVAAGTVLWSIALAGDVEGQGQSIERLPSGDVVVGVSLADVAGSRASVRRIDPAAVTSWIWDFELGAEDVYTWGLSVGVDAAENPAIGVAAYGYDSGDGVVGWLDDGGQLRWQVATAGVAWFGAALTANAQLWVAGASAGEGIARAYDLDGMLVDEYIGPPYAPASATFYDVVATAGGLAGVGASATDGGAAGFMREAGGNGQLLGSLTFTPASYSEALALALDPAVPERRWVVGYADGLGGWIDRIDAGDRSLAPTVATKVFSANLHGVAVDASGHAIAVGWDSAEGTRDPYVVKVAPSGDVVWSATQITDEGDDDLRDVVVGDDGFIYVVGTRVDAGGTRQAWIAQLAP